MPDNSKDALLMWRPKPELAAGSSWVQFAEHVGNAKGLPGDHVGPVWSCRLKDYGT